MQRFCTKCGSPLDDKTGKCPVCDRVLTKKDIKKQDRKDKKEARKKAKKEKWQSLSPKEKAEKISFGVLIVFLIMVILALSVFTVIKLSNHIEIPIVSEIKEKPDYSRPVKRKLKPTDDKGIKYHSISEDHIATDDGFTYMDNEIIVALESERYKDELTEYIDSIGGKIEGYIEEALQYQIVLDKKYSYKEIKRLVRDMENHRWVVFASPNYVIQSEVSYTPNDKKWKKKWDTIPEGTNWGMEAIDAPGAWDEKNNLSSVNIGVIDSVFDVNHEDLVFAEQPYGQSYLPNNHAWDDHGTHTAGTIGAVFDNKKGVCGVVPNVNLYGVSAFGLENKFSQNTMNACLRINMSSMVFSTALGYLITNKNCSVINISMGYGQMTFEASRKGTHAQNQLEEFSNFVERSLKNLIDKGYQFVICKASGNLNEVGGEYKFFKKDANDNNTPFDYYPYSDYLNYLGGDTTNAFKFARYKNRQKEIEARLDSGNVDAKYDIFGAITDKDVANRIIMVGAVENLGTKGGGLFGLLGEKEHLGYKIAPYSQCGTRVDILAPGTDIYSTIKNGYQNISGTSMAAPHVTGVAGLMFAADPNLKADYVKDILIDTSEGSYGTEGYGLVNAKNAVEAVLNRDYEEEYEDDDEYEDDEDYQEYEDDEKIAEKPKRVTSDERDIVLVLDASGSMAGTPMAETKKASLEFINTILKEDASIGIVTYDSSASMRSDFSVNERSLKGIVESIYDGGGTNIESGLTLAQDMLSQSNAKKKIIVLMSDGEPNDGKIGDELISYADKIKDDDTYIYTLGFFGDLGDSKSSAQILMEKIASEGCHYEVSDADDLVFFFGDIADQINGQKYIYIRIACPVDVSVTYDGETLSSENDDQETRTSFGSLTFEENTKVNETSSDNRIKILRLKDNSDYDIHIEGNGRGKMDYTIGFMDDDGEYSDLRKFRNVEITKRTEIDTVAENSSSTTLYVDSDGDGKYDIRYKAKANSTGEIVDYSYIYYIILCILLLIVALAVYISIRRWKKNRLVKENEKKALTKKFCIYCGHQMSGDKKYCVKCGKKIE